MKSRVDLHGLEETFTKPITISLSKDILGIFGIGRYVFTHYAENDKLYRYKSKLGDIRHDNTPIEEYFVVYPTEESDEGTELNMVVNKPDTYPIYQDFDIPAYIQSVTHRRRLRLACTYYNKSKSYIESIVNKLKSFTSNDGMYRMHALEYSYSIPFPVVRLLQHFNTLKNLRLDVNERISDDEYFQKHFDNRLVLNGTFDNVPEKSSLSIREAIVNAEGAILTSLHDLNIEYDETEGMYSFAIEYMVSYEKPVMLLLQYPIMVWNTLIAEEFRAFELRETVTNRAIYRRAEYGIMSSTQRHPVYDVRPYKDYLTVPLDDDRIDIIVPYYYTKVFSLLIQVDADRPTDVFNIKDIPNIKFKKSVLDYIINSERDYITKDTSSLFYINIVRGDYKPTQVYGCLKMDKDGNVSTTEPMSTKRTFRIFFYVLNDLDYLGDKHRRRAITFLDTEMSKYMNKIKTRQSPLRGDYRDFKSSGGEEYEDDIHTRYYVDLLDVDYNDVYPMETWTAEFKINTRKHMAAKYIGAFNIEAYRTSDLGKGYDKNRTKIWIRNNRDNMVGKDG